MALSMDFDAQSAVLQAAEGHVVSTRCVAIRANTADVDIPNGGR